jgi:hypothetical protein
MKDPHFDPTFVYVRHTVDGTNFAFLPMESYGNQLATITPGSQTSLNVTSFLYVYSASANAWKRPITETDSSDAVAAGRQSLITLSTVMGYNGTTFDRVRTVTPADAQAGSIGHLAVAARLTGYNGTSFDRLRSETPADGLSGSIGHLLTLSRGQRFNGTTYDREQGNQNISLLASAARTVTTSTSDQLNVNHRGVHVYVDVTAVPGGETLTVDIEALIDTGVYYSLHSGTPINATGVYIYKVYPGLGGGSAIANDALPRTWRVTVTHSAGGSWTYSVRANLMV